jgi:cysteine-rich repeat protein
MLVGRTWRAVTLLCSLALLAGCATGKTETTPTSASSGTGTGGGTGGGTGTGGNDAGPTIVCGDGVISKGEDCDDGNTDDGDGCSATCTFEAGWTCKSAPSVCTTICGDAVLAGGELCDDGNATAGDGCSTGCLVEYGWTCTGAPSKCSVVCGDGIIFGGEKCDDGNTLPGDGCDEHCNVEPGFTCEGVPSACTTGCGDGVIAGNETCDDHNVVAGDGCSATCTVEPSFSCTGEPSICTTACGDGKVKGVETCDDGNLVSGDGCSATCTTEPGYACGGQPSVCVAGCGDGVIVSPNELCDDGNLTSGDGCSAGCKIEAGFKCFGTPSFCLATCGDGNLASVEGCDDGNLTSGDGCSQGCKVEVGFHCSGSPSVCHTNCGDGVTGGTEACDDGNAVSGDGCDSNCQLEPGFSCTTGTPAVCTAICGDGLVVGAEQCDDGNTVGGDCCSPTCTAEPGCEVEPNDATTNANDFAALAIGGQIKGFVQPASDLDVYKVTVPNTPGASGVITATTLDGLGFTCSSNALDSYLTIYDGNGFPITSADGGGTGKCAVVTAPGLVPGDYFVEIRQGSTQPPFGYTLKIDLTVVICGDGVKGPGEQCDDGNTQTGDGCDASCHLETTGETEPNNSCATANGPYTVLGNPVLMGGSITPVGDSDFFGITLLNYADLVLETFDATGPGSCASIDTEISFYAPGACTTPLITDDESGISSCSKVDAAVNPVMRHLAPGTYFVKVFPYSSSATFAYTLQATVTALCGNGIIEGSEQCDGGPTCGADCLALPVCGNFLKQTGEQCDDGNLTSGDGCDATCHWETTPEIEPNDTIAAASTVATSNPNLLLGANRNITGSLSSATDKDLFKVTVTTQSAVRFEIFDAGGTDCIGMPTMVLNLLDSAGVQLKTDSPDTQQSGIGVCPALLVNLAPGTYFIQAQGSSAVPAYFLQAKFEANLGTETEPNDTRPTANPLGGTDLFIYGDHQVATDIDVYAVTVPAGASIRAEIVEGDATETCESNGIDSYLTLYNAGGTSLVTDDDSGRGWCSGFDGTGSSPHNLGAHGLAAGTYYIEVKASGFSSGAGGQFNYLLLVTIR